MPKAKSTPIKVGDRVTFYYWMGGRDGSLHSAPAQVAGVFDADDGPQALQLEVEFPEGVVEQEGYSPSQSYAPQRTSDQPDDIHASGTWSPA